MRNLKEKDAEIQRLEQMATETNGRALQQNMRVAMSLTDTHKMELQKQAMEYEMKIADVASNERLKYFGTPDADALIRRLEQQLQEEVEQHKSVEHDILIAAQEFTKACRTWQEKVKWYETTIASLEARIHQRSSSADGNGADSFVVLESEQPPVTFSAIMDGVQLERRSFVTQLTSAFLYMRMIYTHILCRTNNLPEDDIHTIESSLAQIGRLVTEGNGISINQRQKVMSQDPE